MSLFCYLFRSFLGFLCCLKTYYFYLQLTILIIFFLLTPGLYKTMNSNGIVSRIMEMEKNEVAQVRKHFPETFAWINITSRWVTVITE